MNILEKIRSWVRRLFNKSQFKNPDIKVSDKMAAAINSWFNVFYSSQTKENKPDEHDTKFVTVLTGYMATLVTNEIEISVGSSQRAKYIEEQIKRFVLMNLRENIQLAGVGGEVILKPYISGSDIIPDVITADRFYPTRFNGAGIVEAGFFTDYDKLNSKTVVKVESFDLQPEGCYINNRVFYENADGIGSEVSITEIERWKKLPTDILIKNVTKPLFVQLKMPFANTVDNTSKLPVSIYANSLDALYELNRIYSEFLHEIHTGKRKRIVDITAINTNQKNVTVKPQDLTTDVYLVLDMGSDPAEPFKDYTPEMRVEAYQKAINIQLRLIEMQCGFSTGTFTFDVKTGKATATQIISEDKDTYNTIKNIQNGGLMQPLKDLVYVYDIYASLYNLAPSGTIEPTVSFGDGIFEDTATEFTRRKQLVDAGYLKPEKFISWYFGVSEEEALANYIPEPETPDSIMFGER